MGRGAQIWSRVVVGGCILFFGVPAATSAQATPVPTRIEVSGRATVQAEPDHATISLGVSVTVDDSRMAGDSLGVLLQQVVDTLAALGFPQDSLTRRMFSVSPDRNVMTGGRVQSYTATGNVSIRTAELDRISEIVEAVLRAGATTVNQVRFGTSREQELREEALRLAVQAAERDATVLAETRGARLGALLEITTAPSSGNSGIMLRGPTTITGLSSVLTPELISISAAVGMTWLLIG